MTDPTYGFLGKGSTTQRNAALQLDNFMPGDVGEMYVPAGRGGPGVKHVRTWLEDAYGEDNVTESTDVVGTLLTDAATDTDVVLVVVIDDPPDDADREAIVRAINGGIKVQSVNHAMDEVSILDVTPEQPPSEPQKAAEPRTATRRRRTTTPAPDAVEGVSEPQTKSRGKPRAAAADPAPETPAAPSAPEGPAFWQGTGPELLALIDERVKLALQHIALTIDTPPF